MAGMLMTMRTRLNMALVDKPREIILNDISFSEVEIITLKKLFPEMDMVRLSHEEVRKTPELNKGIMAGAVAFLKTTPEGTLVELNLTQQGRLLLGKV